MKDPPALVTRLEILPWKGSYHQHLWSELHLPDPAWGKKGREGLLEGAALSFSAPKSGFQVLPLKNFICDVHSGSTSPSEVCRRRAVNSDSSMPHLQDLCPAPYYRGLKSG